MTSLNCYALKDKLEGHRVTTLRAFLDEEDRQVNWIGPIRGRNFTAGLGWVIGPSRVPPWVEFLKGGFGDLPARRASSMSAVLLVQIGTAAAPRFFAFAFGAGGRFLLRPGAWHRGYGLRAALNLTYPIGAIGLDETARLIAVQTKTHGKETVKTSRQTTHATSFETFDVDRLRDLVNGATGHPANTALWGKRVTGGDALHFAVEDVTYSDIGDVCLRVEAAHGLTDYRDRFPWLDQVQPVTDPELIKDLERRVLDMLRDPNSSALELGPSEIVNWERTVSFRYHFEAASGVTRPEMRLSHYLIGLIGAKIDEVDAAGLRRRVIEALDGDGTVIHKWTVWRCLDGEVTLDGQTYIMDDGDFFLVDPDFMSYLNGQISAIPPAVVDLPETSAQTREKDYNKQVAAGDDRLLLLDMKLITTEASTTPVEICDLLSDTRQLIHVKRHLGSRDLSHLFSQGFVSARLLQMNPAFRVKVKEKIEAQPGGTAFGFIDTEKLTSSEFEVVYAILANWGGRSLADALPFFSKINLQRTVDDLQSMGFAVSCACVQAG